MQQQKIKGFSSRINFKEPEYYFCKECNILFEGYQNAVNHLEEEHFKDYFVKRDGYV